MKYILIIFLSAIFNNIVYANDGAFFAKGNQLIPISETNIRVKKEILTLRKLENKFIDVTVDYEFYNPGKEKEITVGFEAFSPSGDVNGTPRNGLHPYIRDFTVKMNDHRLNYKVAYVDDLSYKNNGFIKSKQLSEIKKGISNVNEVDFFYVYHFRAKFKKGLNRIKHTYRYDLSGSNAYKYYFEYVLTAANRWGNRQIDDFTLILDPGEFETFDIAKAFFKSEAEWLVNGMGKTENLKGINSDFAEADVLRFHIQKGSIIFSKRNFKPVGELFLYAQNYTGVERLEYLPFSYYQQDNINKPASELERKILMNLPFARRGYVFKNNDISKFYRSMDWYIPNPDYTPNPEALSEIEKKWLKTIR